MAIWFLDTPSRLAHERSAIQALEADQPWLHGTNWGLDAGQLYVEAAIVVGDHEYTCRMTYPGLFPSIPPIVRPADPSQRWSEHQYSNGTLCLEWGPDTWHPDVTGAEVLQSVQRLLEIENPKDSTEKIVAPSRHHLSPGQEARERVIRFYMASSMERFLSAAAGDQPCDIFIRSYWHSPPSLCVVNIVQSAKAGDDVYEDSTIPRKLRGSESEKTLTRGELVKTDLSPEAVAGIKNRSSIDTLVSALQPPLREHVNTYLQEKTYPQLLLIGDLEGKYHLLYAFDEESVCHAAAVHDHNSDRAPRLVSGDTALLSNKRVGIVGLGSAGSKIALSLARTGVSSFFLLDEDIFLPANVCRHALDWRSVGQHKVDAMQGVIDTVALDPMVDVSRLHITGQESTASLSAALNRLGECDVLIDVTADPQVFNIIAAVAASFGKPMVWLEVYAGGIGGMIARSRPNRDPDPSTMRQIYHGAITDAPSVDIVSQENYAAQEPGGKVLVATDADVSIIAYHAARLSLDTLLEREPSVYPYSMYLIGLERAWIFDSPFTTIPVETNSWVARAGAKIDEPVSSVKEALAFVSSLLQEAKNDNTTS